MEDKILDGLTSEQVQSRINNGKKNYNAGPKTKTNKEIIKSNCITYFNILNIVLGLMVLLSSVIDGDPIYGLKNCLFVGVIVTNTIISIIEEIYAKNTIEKLNVLAQSKIKTMRDGKLVEITSDELVLNDICIYEIGNQVVTDVKVLEGKVEVNESFITGENKSILKKAGDEILSGSFIVSGKAYTEVIRVGKENFVSKITAEAKYVKATNSIIYNSFDKLVKILSFCLIPIGVLFMANQLKITSGNIPSAIMSTVSALIGMIPEGLVLLTSSAMAVSVIRMKRYHVLVQELYSVENLARVNVLCLDKTGTITTGTMEVHKIIEDGASLDKIEEILGNYINAQDDNSATFEAIKEKVKLKKNFDIIDTLAFSSERKYSGVSFKEGNFYLGSPDNLLKKVSDDILEYQEDYRVLALVKGSKEFGDISSVKVLGYILIEDMVKQNAGETLSYLAKQGIKVKIISGDNPTTVSKIAQKVGIVDVKAIDFSKIDSDDIPSYVEEYNIFGRVKPEQKKKIVLALQKKGYMVGMTGDGVNDCLALKTADCSIAMGNGSDAAKTVSQFILLDNKIDNLPLILKEGRRAINNIGRSSSLLLNKTIFTVLLILFAIFLSTEYFFIPIHLTLITMCTISIPSFLLALEKNDEEVKGNFLQKAFLRAFPCALTVAFNVIIVALFKKEFGIDANLASTLSVFLTATTGFIFLNSLCKPYTIFRGIMMGLLVMVFIYCTFFQYDFFSIGMVNFDTVLVFVIMYICSVYIFDKLQRLSKFLLKKTGNV